MMDIITMYDYIKLLLVGTRVVHEANGNFCSKHGE